MGFLVFLVILCPLLSVPCFGAIVSDTWEVEYMHWSPDCIESVVMGINHKFPGPEIRAVVGDTLKITVINKLHTEGLVIHWHGILQNNTPWFDGTASISQCAINPGETFVYEFIVDKPGTYFYHGHYGMQRAAGLYGSLIVEDSKKGKEESSLLYDGEFKKSLLLSDWWHRSVHAQEVDLSSKKFRFIGEPQTLLINGKGQYNCSLAPNNPSLSPSPSPSPTSSPSAQFSETQCNFEIETNNGVSLKDQCGPEILNVEPGKTYRLRVASTTSLSSLNLRIENHKMKVVEADGNYVEPFDIDDLDIYSGESYSVLVTANQDVSKNYWISVGVRGREPNTNQGLALLSYVAAAGYPNTKPPVVPRWNDYGHSKALVKKLNAKTETKRPPLQYNKQIKLLNTQVKVKGYLKWAINGISLTLPPTPYLGSIKYNIKEDFDQTPPPDTYLDSYDISSIENYPNANVSSAVYKLQHNQVIDVIIQNAKMLNGHSEIHPWHLHGHDFWVLGYGEGKFSEADKEKFNLNNPPLKNTVSVFPGGWTALRFVTDNPGVWAFHCHIEPHLHMGMGVIFVEAEDKIKKMEVPNEAISCGHTAKFLMNPRNHHHHPHHQSHHHKTNMLLAPAPQPSPQG